MTDISQNYDLVTGHDARGQVWTTWVPPGAAKPGMYIRLVGGVFVLAEAIEFMGRYSGKTRAGSATEILAHVWGGSVL